LWVNEYVLEIHKCRTGDVDPTKSGTKNGHGFTPKKRGRGQVLR